MVEDLQAIIELVGEDKIILGTDGIYTQLLEPEMLALFERMPKNVDANGIFGASYPPKARILNTPHKLKVIETLLESGRFGFSKERTAKIMGLNALLQGSAFSVS